MLNYARLVTFHKNTVDKIDRSTNCQRRHQWHNHSKTMMLWSSCAQQ